MLTQHENSEASDQLMLFDERNNIEEEDKLIEWLKNNVFLPKNNTLDKRIIGYIGILTGESKVLAFSSR